MAKKKNKTHIAQGICEAIQKMSASVDVLSQSVKDLVPAIPVADRVVGTLTLKQSLEVDAYGKTIIFMVENLIEMFESGSVKVVKTVITDVTGPHAGRQTTSNY